MENKKFIAFVNTEYKDNWEKYVPNADGKVEYRHGTATTEDFIHWGVYDGAINNVGWVNAQTGEIKYNGDATEYKRTFLECAKKELVK